jgi:hypothetical protein
VHLSAIDRYGISAMLGVKAATAAARWASNAADTFSETMRLTSPLVSGAPDREQAKAQADDLLRFQAHLPNVERRRWLNRCR